MIEHAKQFGKSRLNRQTYKRYPWKSHHAERDGGRHQRAPLREETEERPQWTLSADTATIIGYVCNKAECFFKGRRWTAVWQIPSGEGLWKLFGLPGLIHESRRRRKALHLHLRRYKSNVALIAPPLQRERLRTHKP